MIRYQVARFYGTQWSVIDTQKNTTVGVYPGRKAAREEADAFNSGTKVPLPPPPPRSILEA